MPLGGSLTSTSKPASERGKTDNRAMFQKKKCPRFEKAQMPYCDEVSSPSLAYLNAVNCDVDCVKAHCSRGPVGTVGSISVGTDEHVLTGSVEKW